MSTVSPSGQLSPASRRHSQHPGGAGHCVSSPGGPHCPRLSVCPAPDVFPTAPGTTCGLDWEPHSVRAVRIEFLSRQNQLNGTHSPNTECVCVCTRVHIARKERAGARALVHPKALPGLQPTDAHSAPGSLGLDTRTRSCASGSLLGLLHGCTSSPRQQSLSPRETAPLAGS